MHKKATYVRTFSILYPDAAIITLCGPYVVRTLQANQTCDCHVPVDIEYNLHPAHVMHVHHRLLGKLIAL